MDEYVKLPQPPLLDFTKIQPSDDVKVEIRLTHHKFATDAEFSGIDFKKQPIFGHTVYINGEKYSESSFGLPFMRFPKGSTPKITYENRTRFTTNIHYHGLNTTGSIDGVSMEDVFGISTQIGPVATFQFPTITNNSALLWMHSHNMFISMELITAGLVGLLQIVDKPTEWLTEEFQYGDNQILLVALDMDLTSKGTQTFANLIADEARSCFSVVNGISVVNWYSEESVPFVNKVYHTSNKNLVKIDILNASLNWRVFHLGVCDMDGQIKPFYQVSVDSGLMNPTELTMVFVPIAGRVGIIIDLNQFKDQVAYLFYYNFDLTEVIASVPTFPDQPNNPSITALIPDLKIENPTPYPSPIPDPNHENQQGNYSYLNYPNVAIIPQVNQVLENGSIPVPKHYNIKTFLKIDLEKKCTKHQREKCKHHKEKCKHQKKCKHQSLSNVISRIRKTIFGYENYCELNCLLKQPCFEYDENINYLSLLNKNYYYNLPDFNVNVPTRNIFLFPEVDTNAIASGNVNGTTEYVFGANRMMADQWNSAELNLEWALQQYALAPNNYKPPVLPTAKFRIYKTNDTYSNTAMISNDTLKIQIFKDEIAYGNLSQEPLATVTIIFPPTPPCGLMNVQQWLDLVNKTFRETTVIIEGKPVKVNTILECDWSFFPYAIEFEYQKTAYVKSAVIKTKNKTKYWVRFLGRWPLLQLFGKPLTASSLSPPGSTSTSHVLSRLQVALREQHALIRSRYNEAHGIKNEHTAKKIKPISKLDNHLPAMKTIANYTKCDEFAIYGIYDGEVTQLFPFYATFDGDVQLPIACMKRDAELIISPKYTYIGLYDGYLNDNLSIFSVRLHSSEIWIYTNGDCADAHSLHFHLTSGYTPTESTNNSPGLVSCRRLYDPLIYSRDIYQIGPQESASFYITWPYYSSYEETQSPKPPRCVGGVVHCHLLQHNDFNSMIIQYFIDKPLEESESKNHQNNPEISRIDFPKDEETNNINNSVKNTSGKTKCGCNK